MFDKVKFLARNVIYIRNFSKGNIKEETKQSVCKGAVDNESNVLFRSKNLELRLIDGQDELLLMLKGLDIILSSIQNKVIKLIKIRMII